MRKDPIRAVFLDLDGTLLHSDKTLSPANQAALAAAAKQGVEIVPCSGRTFPGMPEVLRVLPFLHYAISDNGAVILDTVQNRSLYRAEIPYEMGEAILDLVEGRYDVQCGCHMDNWAWAGRSFFSQAEDYILDKVTRELLLATSTELEDLRATVQKRHDSLQKIHLFFRHMEERAAARSLLTEQFPELTITSSIPNNLELNWQGADKGLAMCWLCSHLGFSAASALACGDNENDLSMIRAAGIGVAMGNAAPEVQAESDFVTKRNDEDGVAYAIHRFILHPAN